MSTITITDQITAQTATIDTADLALTILAWYAGAPVEVTDAIAALQRAAQRGEWTDVNDLADYLALTITR